jgi:hypothetical protein
MTQGAMDIPEGKPKPDFKDPFSWTIHSDGGWIKVVIVSGSIEKTHYYHTRAEAVHGLAYRLGRGELGK